MTIDYILLTILLLAVIWTVMTIRLIRAVVGLAIVSVIVSIIMFRLSSDLAAVFELSVCAGLISVIFITTISFTSRVSKERLRIRRKERLSKFWALPIIIIAAIIILSRYHPSLNIMLTHAVPEPDVRKVLWNMRHIDLMGQVIILLVGVFGVVVLFKEGRK